MCSNILEDLKRFLLFLLCWLGALAPVWAGQPSVRADSLLQLLGQSALDTTRVNLFILLAWDRTDDNPLVAIEYGQRSRRLARALSFRQGECRALLMLGWAFLRSGNYPTAVQSQLKARQVAEAIGYRGGIVHADNGLGYAHLEQGSPRLALRYFFRAMHLAEAINDQVLLTPIPGNIGAAYLQLGKLDSARYYTELGYQLDQQQHDWHSEIGDLALLGDIAARRGNAAEAERYYRQSIEQAKGWPVSYALCRAWLGLARQAQNPTTGLQFAQRGLHASLDGGYAKGVLDASDFLASLYAAQSDSARAYAHLRRASVVRDSLFSLNRRVQVQALEFSEQLRQQAIEEEGRRTAAQKRQTLLLLALLMLSAATGVGYLVISRRHLRRKMEFLEDRQRLERRHTAEMLQVEEKERRRMGADLHDGVGQLLSAARMNLAALQHRLQRTTPEAEPSELLTTAITIVDESVREVRSISHGLMPVALQEKGLKQAVHELLARLRQSAPGLVISLHVTGLQAARLESTTETLVYRIIQEAVQNVVKHAHATTLHVQLMQSSTELMVVIEDNGRGFLAEAADASGLGMHNIRRRASYLNASFQVSSTLGQGTRLALYVPLPASE